MARVQQTTIDKTLNAIGALMQSPAFPSSDALLESNKTLCNVVTLVIGQSRNVPVKTLCGLLVEALDLGKDITGEALWKRYRRATANRDTESGSVSAGNVVDNINRDGSNDNRAGSNVNRDTSRSLFIPPGISQTDLAAGIAGFFKAHGRNSASLLKTCLFAMNEMADSMEISEITDAIDALYVQHDVGDTDEIKS